jgi:transposase
VDPDPREHYRRRTPRYQTDLTDAECHVIEPLLPPAKKMGRPRTWPLREIVNAIFYVLRGGIAWRLLPSDFPPWSTVYRWFAAWRDACVFETINHALIMANRERLGREASPSAATIDSQSVKTTEAGGPRGSAIWFGTASASQLKTSPTPSVASTALRHIARFWSTR